MCSEACPNRAHVFDSEDHRVLYEKCTQCNRCIAVCCHECLTPSGTAYTAKELAKTLLLDQAYYRQSNGGVTFSGGEPMAQYDFVRETVDRMAGIHITLDTSGHCAKEAFAETLKQADLVLFDLKHMDSRQHKALTGADNALILENFEALAESGVDYKVRYPMIPDLNDSDANLAEMASFLKRHGVNSLDVSIYHDYGTGKYMDMGLLSQNIRPYAEPRKQERLAFIQRNGITPIIV
jgi:pyruvate formate lyase activating enzyme